MTTQEKPSIFPILLVNFIGTLGYSVVLPFLVILVLQFGGNELIYGIMGATYSFFQLIGAPVLGEWSDKIGRRKVLLLSQGGTFLAWVVFLIALLVPISNIAEINTSLTGVFMLTVPLLLLFFARALDGVTGGNVSVANAYLVDVTSESDRKANFGKMAASGNMGFIIGPAAAGLLGGTSLGNILPVVMAMLISLVAIAVIGLQLKDFTPKALTKAADPKQTRKLYGMEHKECHKMDNASSFRRVLRIENIPFMITLYFMVFLAFNFFYVAFPVHAVQELKWSIVNLGVFFSVMGGLMVLFQGPVLTKISKKFSDATLVIMGSAILAIGFVLFFFNNMIVIFVGLVFFSLGNGIMWPSFLSVLSKVAGEESQGAVQGYASSAGSLASIIGLIAGGIFYGSIGHYIFIIPAIIMVLLLASSFKLLGIDRSIPNASQS